MRELENATVGTRFLAHSRYDAILVALSFVHLGLLVTAPSFVVVAFALWWNANTISHNFIHLPFFGANTANRTFSIWLSLLLGLPQSLWRDRHLAHHSGKTEVPIAIETRFEAALIAMFWLALLVTVPGYFLSIYLPGYVAGLALCHVHGRFEHAPEACSHYGRLYNAWFFNDGYHVEHHARPDCHWASLPATGRQGKASALPAVLRWLPLVVRICLNQLERHALRSPKIMRYLLHRHESAMRRLAPRIGQVRHIAIVGGGLFPRSVIVCRRLFPRASIRVIDASAEHIDTARTLLDDVTIGFEHSTFEPGQVIEGADLAVVPLALSGSRRKVYELPPAPLTLVHDWLWAYDRRTGTEGSVVVSAWLMKRLTLIRRR